MADSAVLALAKTWLDYDTSDTGLVTLIANCEASALILLEQYLSLSDISRYLTTQSLTFSKAEAAGDSLNEQTKLYLNTVTLLKIGDIITVSAGTYAGTYVILEIDRDNKTVTILKTYTATTTGTITNNSLTKYLHANAYLILYKLALHAQTIVKGDIIYSSQQFGQGTNAPGTQENKQRLARRYYDQAMQLISTILCQ